MNPEQFKYLLDKYLQNKISQTELAQFLEAAREEQYQALIKDVLTRQLQNPPLHAVSDAAKLDALFSDMLARTTHRPWYKRRWVAAAVVIGLLAGGFLIINRKEQSATTPVVATKTIPPGCDGAVLTLADGKKIELDTIQNGILSSHNGITVSMHNGRLVYQADVTGKNAGIYHTISTPRGRQFRVVLSDGTRIWLNADSHITFPAVFAGHERRVELSGEAYLEVAPKAHQPFRVTTHGAEVRVLGTIFNISAYENESTIRTTLLEGSIQITFAKSSGGKKEMLLQPGEQVDINRAGDASLVNNNEHSLDAAVAWKNGLFVMKGADVQMIMRQIERWYNIKVTFEGAVPEGRISGEMPRSLELHKLLEIIKASGIAISFKWEGNELVVSRPA
jgi:Fe2+-dicitrate sensor, membrane component